MDINKAARIVINHCLKNQIGTIVFGSNQGNKHEIELGHKNNSEFVPIPTARLKQRITQLSEEYGITFIETEESYTSIASFLDGDYLPTYGEKPNDWKPKSFGHAASCLLRRSCANRGAPLFMSRSETRFMSRSETGKRIKRGLYRTGNNWCVNADCNGAANIITKVSRKLGLNLSRLCRGTAEIVPKEYIFGQLRIDGATRIYPVA